MWGFLILGSFFLPVLELFLDSPLPLHHSCGPCDPAAPLCCRVVTKNRLVAYLNSMHKQMEQMASDAQMMGPRGEAWFHEQMRLMEPVVDLHAQIILFGIDEPNARRR